MTIEVDGCHHCKIGTPIPLDTPGYHKVHTGWREDKRTPYFSQEIFRLEPCSAAQPAGGIKEAK